jgi:hypothetical protein
MSKISELSDGGVIQGGDTLIAVRSGGNVKVTYGGSTTANIDGGTIDGTTIGGTTPAAGSFTSLTSTGIDVTGTVTADGLTVDSTLATIGSGGATNQATELRLEGTSNAANGAYLRGRRGGSSSFLIGDTAGALGSGTGVINYVYGSNPWSVYTNANERLAVDGNGDISFYDSSGTSQSLYWDASAESLGIGTSSPSAKLAVVGTTKVGEGVASNTSKLMVNTASGTAAGIQLFQDGVESWIIQNPASTTALTFANSGSERMRIDSSGNVGVGTSSPTADLSVGSTTTSSGDIHLRTTKTAASITPSNTDAGGLDIGVGWVSGGQGPLTFTLGSTEAMRIDSNGNVGIGNSSPAGLLHVDGFDYSYFSTNVGSATLDNAEQGLAIGWNKSSGGGETVLIANQGAGSIGGMAFATNTSTGSYNERMRIDSSGNLLVGKTSLGIGVTGSEIRAGGQLLVTADGDNPADFNRKTSDGTIALFRQDSTTVGSIGVGDSDNLYITGGAGSTKGLIFTDDRIIAGANGYNFQDDNTTLGHPSYRFKDLYLSGGVYLGGTGSANKLDDYEEGTWTPAVNAGSISGTSITYTGTYTKIGRQVYIYFNANSTSGNINISSYVTFSGLPFSITYIGTGTAITEDIDQFDRQGYAAISGTTLSISNAGSSSGTTSISVGIVGTTS